LLKLMQGRYDPMPLGTRRINIIISIMPLPRHLQHQLLHQSLQSLHQSLQSLHQSLPLSHQSKKHLCPHSQRWQQPQ